VFILNSLNMRTKFLLFLVAALVFVAQSCEESKANSETKKPVTAAKKEPKKVRNGIYKSYYDDAKKILMSEVEYTDGNKDGIAIDYYKDGTIRLKGGHLMGKNHGDFVYNHPDGRVYRKMQYDFGKLHGWDSVFYKSGRLQHAIPYDSGEIIPGTIEFDNRYKQVPLPKIKLREVNRIDVSNEYYLFASLTEKMRDTRFEIGIVANGTVERPASGFEKMAFIDKNEEEALFIIPLKPGYEYVGKLVVKTTGKTKRGNPFQVLQVFPVVLR